MHSARATFCLAVMVSLFFAATGLAAQTSIGAAELREGIRLEGSWDFYWQEFIDPVQWTERYQADDSRAAELAGGFWDADGFPRFGYGSYVRHFELSEDLLASGLTVGLQLRDVMYAYRVYVNGRLMLENGKPALRAEDERGSFRMRTLYFTPDSRELEILFHVSNHHDVNAGFRHAPLLGDDARVSAAAYALRMLDLFIFGALLIMAVYHLGLYYLRRSEKSPLYFGLFTLSLAIRGGLTAARFLHDIVPGISLGLLIDIEIITVYIAALCLNGFITSLYGDYEIRWFSRLLTWLVPIYSVMALFLSIPAHIPFHIAFEILLIIEGGLLIYYLFRALRDRKSGAGVMLAGIVLIVAAVVNDIIYDLVGSNGMFLSSYGLFVFTFLQAFLISQNFTRAFQLSERFSSEMHLMANSFSRFVPREFLKMLNKESILHIQLGDQVELDMAVMFCDIRQFTSLSEKMNPGENFNFINSYLGRISPVIRENNGFIDKYIGDGIMALFPGNPSDALNAASALLQTLDEYNLGRKNAGYREIRVGIGINRGKLMLGTIGEEHRLEGTVISDTVNLASRLEQLTKVFGSDVIISSDVARSCPESRFFEFRKLGRIRVKGKDKPVAIFEVLAPGDRRGGNALTMFESALDSYLTGDFAEAGSKFALYNEFHGEDPAALFYIDRITDISAQNSEQRDPTVLLSEEEGSGDIL